MQLNQKQSQHKPSSFVKSNAKVLLLGSLAVTTLGLSGCATSELLDSGSSYSSTTSTEQVLVQDELVAFGRPATRLPNMPASSVVIVGEKNSYVLSQGGPEMVNLLTNLDPKNIRVENEMRFYSPKNDGYFQGQMKLSYAKLKDDFQRSDYNFFLQNGAKECSSSSDERMNAQRFCFTVPIQGGVYPAVSNLSLIQSKYSTLSKPYPVTIYTKTESTTTKHRGTNTAGKLVLLPFALAFDVVTFPFQLLDAAN